MIRNVSLAIFLILLLWLTGCINADSPLQPTRTSSTEVAVKTVESTAVSPTKTLIPSQTPTHLPIQTEPPIAVPNETAVLPTPSPTAPIWVTAGTAVPLPSEPISLENAKQLTQLARWGRGVINDIAISGNGRWVAVGTPTGIYIHDSKDLSSTRYHLETPTSVQSLAISPDGKFVAARLSGELLQVWDVEMGQIMYEKTIATTEINISADGEQLILNNRDGVHILQAQDGEILQTYPDALEAQFSADVTELAVWNYSTVSVFLWPENQNIAQIEPLPFLMDDGREFFSVMGAVRYLPDGQPLLSALPYNPAYGTTGDVLVQQGHEGQLNFEVNSINPLTEPTMYVCNEPIVYADPPASPQPWQMGLSADGEIIAFVFRGGGYQDDWEVYTSVRFYQRDSGQLLYDVEEGIVDMAFSPTNDTWVAGLQDGQLQIRSIRDGAVLDSIDVYDAPALKTAVSPDNELVGVEYLDGIKIFQAETGELLDQYAAQRITFAPNNETIALGYDDGNLEIRSLSDKRLLRTIYAHTDEVTAVAYLPTGELVSVGLDCGFHLWQPEDGTKIKSFENYLVEGYYTGEPVPFRIWELSISQGNKFLVGQLSSEFGVWDIEKSTLLHVSDIQNYVDGIAVLDDKIAVAGSPLVVGQLRTNGEFKENWDGHGQSTTTVTFSPDGEIVLSGAGEAYVDVTRNGALQLLFSESGDLVHEVEPMTNSVTSLAFAPNGRYFVSTTDGGVVRLWGVP